MRLPQPGEILEGKYQLESVLGQGAFGLVFRATTLSTNRPVAVKVLKPAPDSRSGSRSARFLRELRTIANLQCPNTLTLYDYGRTNDGVLFMVTEYIEGEDLYDMIARRGPLAEHEVIHVLHQALLSLSEAHDLNVLHRDIKPHNIRICQYQEDPLRVKMLDFGLSKSLEDEPGDGLTGVGLIVGTPRYMSPEQLRGKPLTAASDIYSLGLVAYEMLLGRPAVALDALVGQTKQIQITPEDRITRGLRDVVNKMLRRPLPERYRTATEVMAALKPLRMRGIVDFEDEDSDTIADGGSVTELLGERPERRRRVEEAPRRPNTAAILAGISALLVVVVGVLAWQLLKDGEEEPPIPIAGTRTIVRNTEPEEPTPKLQPAEADTGAEPAAAGSGRCSGLEAFRPGVQTVSRLAGITREEALVRIPEGYDPQKRYGLIWVFHDYGTSADEFIRGIDYAAVDDLKEYIVLSAQADKLASWSLRREFDTALIGLDVAREYLCLDPDRFFVWGHGFGGRVATRRAMCMESVTAVATTSYRERVTGDLCKPSRDVPFLQISPLNDPVAPADGSRGCFDHLLPEGPTVPIDQNESYFKSRNHCAGAKKELPPTKHGECYTWSCKVPYEACRVEGGRQLPTMNNPQRACLTIAPKFPFAKTVIDFFERHPKPPEE